FAALELLRHRVPSLTRPVARGDRFVSRQLSERRGRAGDPEHERDVRMGRARGPAMNLVLKIGGAALENKELVAQFCETVGALAKGGHQLLVVHGGGAALSRTLKELGIEPKFVNGLRVTDAKTRDVAVMVLGGLLNKQLAAAIGATGQEAIGICGSDLHLCTARKKATTPDLGYVGE